MVAVHIARAFMSAARTPQHIPANVHHVLAPSKILIMHSSAQIPTSVGGDLFSDENCSSQQTASIQTLCWWTFLSTVFTIGSRTLLLHNNYDSLMSYQCWDQLEGGPRYEQTTNPVIFNGKKA
jgi:hypothetical protein